MPLNGAYVRENWLAYLRGDPLLSAIEVILFSDGYITGELQEQPYEFLNTVSSPKADVDPAVVLRLNHYWFPERRPIALTNDFKGYHGGTWQDEVAALASLVLGVRIRCGPMIRRFEPASDERGKPYIYGRWDTPALRIRRNCMLPFATQQVSLNDLTKLRNITCLSAVQSRALIKAARLYQESLWLAEVDPEDAWLLLVSAVETLATLWQDSTSSKRQRFRLAYPELELRLAETGDTELMDWVADYFGNKTLITARFVSFLLAFAPSPPILRPPVGFRVPWDEDYLEAAYRRIYKHRSNYLHDGIAFPHPLLEPPERFGADWDAPGERPTGIAMSTGTATWNRDEFPMCLHTFEGIVRQALLTWWSVTATAQTGP